MMGSTQKRKSNGSLMFQPHKPHFFTVILEDPVVNGRLGIPKKFARKYGSELSTPAILKVPSGATWKVELIKSDSDIWLGEGWLEFAKYYSVVKTFFLVFEYQGECNFDVVIFDISATEVDYPLSTNNNNYNEMRHSEGHFQDQKVIKIEDGDDGPIQNLNNHSKPSKRKNDQLPLPGGMLSKRMRSNSTGILESAPVRRNGRINMKEHCFGGKSEDRGCNTSMFEKTSTSTMVRRTTPLTLSERAELLQRANDAFVSSNPYFMVALQPSYIYSYLEMPPTFARKYVGMQRDTTILHVGDGRMWPVKFHFNKRMMGKIQARISEGWRKFILDNHLEVGDVCAFEIVRCTEFSMKVSIFRFQDSTRNKSLGNTKQVKQEMSSGNELTQKPLGSRTLETVGGGIKISYANPFFKVEMESRHLASTCCMNVPQNTFLQCIQGKSEDVVLKVADKEWPVRLLRRSANCAVFSAGWKRFAIENSLQVGDICKFELIERATPVIKVSISKHSG